MTGDYTSHIFWIGSRAAGIVAMTMLTFTVIVGLAQGGRLPLGVKARDLTRVHEFVSLAALVAIVVHGALLIFDPWLKATVTELLVPFKLDYRPLYSGLGIVGAWIAMTLGLSYYARDRIGINRWKTLHRFTIVAWALCVVHVLGAGSDAGEAWLKGPVIASTGVIVVMFALRVLSRPAPARQQRSSYRSMPHARPTPAPTLHR
ncbi:MAG: ferric reductase-like transmembrane domain-containing protein [Solirubrobacterales bacterium]